MLPAISWRFLGHITSSELSHGTTHYNCCCIVIAPLSFSPALLPRILTHKILANYSHIYKSMTHNLSRTANRKLTSSISLTQQLP